MTLQQFKILTAPAAVPTLRQAMVRALSTETPRTPDAYARFYCRVLRELGLGVTRSGDCGAASRQTESVAA